MLQYGGKQSKIRLFPSLRPNAKRKREEYDVVYAEYAKNKPPSEYETDDSDAGAQGKGKGKKKRGGNVKS